MLFLTKEDIESVISMEEAIETNKKAFRMYSEGTTTVPLRTNIQAEKGQNLYMPAYLSETNSSGVKIVSIFPDNPAIDKPTTVGQMVMLDGETGEVSAIMDGTYLTQLRTGAAQGAATDLLARKDAKKAVLIGAGGQAESQLDAMVAVRDLEEVTIIDLNTELANNFANAMNNKYEDINVHVAEDTDKAISEADIITSVTTAPGAVYDGSLIKPGCHINGIGSYTVDMKETPKEAFEKADVVVVDTFDAVFAEAGDVMQALDLGIITKDECVEIGQLVNDASLGRQSDDQITVFNSVGSAVLDVAAGQAVLDKAKELGKGTSI